MKKQKKVHKRSKHHNDDDDDDVIMIDGKTTKCVEEDGKEQPQQEDWMSLQTCMLTFLQHSSSTTTTSKKISTQPSLFSFLDTTKNDDISKRRASLKHSVETLLRYWRNDDTTTTTTNASSLIPKHDIASTLVPWSIETILQSSSSSKQPSEGKEENMLTLVSWQILATGLSFFYDSKDDDDNRSCHPKNDNKTLLSYSQSIWNKLIVLAMKLAVSMEEEEDKLREAASTCYCRIAVHLDHYHPTMDFVCESVLPSIPTSSKSLIPATLQFLSRLIGSSKSTSPKKIFYVLSSSHTFSSMIQLFFQEQKQTEAIIYDIFYHGFFDPHHHLDGFVRILSSKQHSQNNNEANKQTSTNPTTGSSYQQTFFDTLHSLLSSSSNNNNMDEDNNNNYENNTKGDDDDNVHDGNIIMGYALAVPLLMEAFIVQMKEREDRMQHGAATLGEVGKKRKKTASQTAANNNISFSQNTISILFRFWCHVLQPLIDILKQQIHKSKKINTTTSTKIRVAIIQTIYKSFVLLSKYDIYHSSYPDPKRIQFSFLNQITSLILQALEKNHLHNQLVALQSMNFFQVALQLNHHLIHPNLHRLIQLIIPTTTCPSKSKKEHQTDDTISLLNMESTKLFCQIVDTYQKLRQLSEFVNSMLKTFGAKSSNNDYNIHLVMKNEQILHSMTKAIHDCPPGQIDLIWNTLNDFILHKSSSYFDPTSNSKNKNTPKNSTSCYHQTDFAADLLILLTKSVCVGKSSASSLRALCEKSIDTSVANLINHGANNNNNKTDQGTNDFNLDQLMRNMMDHDSNDDDSTVRFHFLNKGLDICGWIVALHTKCCFWQNQISNDSAGISLLNKDDTTSGNGSSSLSIIPCILEGARKILSLNQTSEIKNNPVWQTFLSSLQHLSCHRIQQLHSMIYQQEQAEGTISEDSQKDKEKPSMDMIQEASLLVDFLIHVATNRQATSHDNNDNNMIKSDDNNNGEPDNNNTKKVHGGMNTGWKMLSQMLGSWTPYSSPHHIRSYLTWFFSVISCSDEYFLKSADNDDDHYLPIIKETLSTNILKGETQLCLTILQDASFFETEHIADQFVSTGITMAYEILLCSICNTNNNDKNGTSCDNDDNRVEIKIGSDSIPLATSLDSDMIKLTDTNLLARLIDSTNSQKILVRKKKYRGKYCEKHLCQVLHLLRILNGLPIEIYLSKSARIILNMYLKTHIMILNLLKFSTDPQMNDILVKILCCSKNILMKILSKNLLTSLNPPYYYDSKTIGIILDYEFHSMRIIMDQQGKKAFDGFNEDLIFTTSRKVFQELLLYCVNASDTDREPFSVFKEYFNGKLKEITSDPKTDIPRSNINFIISSLQTIVFMNECGLRKFHQKRDGDDPRLRDEFFEAFSSLKKDILKKLFSSVRKYFASRQVMDENGCEIVILISYILKYSSLQKHSVELKELMDFDSDSLTVLQQMISCIEDCIQGQHKKGNNDYQMKSVFIHLLYTCVSFAESSPELLSSQNNGILPMKLMLLQQGEQAGQVDPLLESSFVDYISRTTGDNISSLCIHLLGQLHSKNDNYIAPQRTAAALYCFHLMIIIAKGQLQKDGLIDYVRPFMNLSMDLQHSFCRVKDKIHDVKENNNIRIAQNFIKTIIMKKDLLTLNIGEISLILARLNGVFCFQNNGVKVDEALFITSCDVILALFKHYPKQLYGSSPVLMSTLRSLLYFLMAETEIKRTNDAMNDEKYQKFCKICELLMVHKEVYKKHVVGLLLDFVTYMQDKPLIGKKDLLLQSVYLLLDTLSNHEQEELNAKMDLVSKTMFRSVHQSYQKNHQYKGKF